MRGRAAASKATDDGAQGAKERAPIVARVFLCNVGGEVHGETEREKTASHE